MDERKIYPLSRVDPADTKIELNCRTVKCILVYFEEKYGREKLEEFIYNTGMNLDYLEDRNNWVSYDYFCRLLAKLVEYTGDARAPYIAGTYSTTKECYGSLERFFTSLGNVSTTFKLVVEYASRCVKMDTFKISNLKNNGCTITLHFSDNYKQDKNNCLNVQGLLASIPRLFSLPLARVKEVACAAEEGDSCVYHVSWRNRMSHLLGLLSAMSPLVVFYVVTVFTDIVANPMALLFAIIVGYLIGHIWDYKVMLRENIIFNEKESKDLMESVETIERLNVELQNRVEQRTKELQKALTDLKNSQNQLIQSEKMASIGRLAAGMAHELNNPVGALRNYIQDVLEDTPENDQRWERLKRAEKTTGRCKRLVNDLLTFSRESKELKLVDINGIVETTVANAEEEISNRDIKIVKELKRDLPKIRVDPLQLQQVFMNVVMNAGDAIKGRGEIYVKTSNIPQKIVVEISDTGGGIPKDIQDKIFDPFFTTKAPGKGTGLGLAISYNIVKRFNGDMQLKSKDGKGATFIITLPVEDKVPAKT